MNPMARVRNVLARRPWLLWLLVLAVAAAAGLVAASAAAGIDEQRRSWGEPRRVAVATATIEPGAPVAPAVERRALPVPLVPPDALDHVPGDAVARQRIALGEVVVAHDVAAPGGAQAFTPPGWRAVAVVERVPTGVAIGDEVDVASGGVVLARAGVVVAVYGESVIVAVPAAAAAQVAQAAFEGQVGLLLAP